MPDYPRYLEREEVRVGKERGIVLEQREDGWARVEFPDRTRFASGGWVPPKDIRRFS